jgi:putative heme iron utilization protein
VERRPDPVRATDDEARALARGLVEEAAHGALGVLDPETGGPHVTRIAVAREGGVPLTLISQLSHHTRALAVDPRCSLLLGEPGPRGDPLTHPRLTVLALARPAAPEERDGLRALWLERHPKARLYVDFSDFAFVRLVPTGAHLNGGFGRAYRLGPSDLVPGIAPGIRPRPQAPA